MHPYYHALSSVKKWGGSVEDYLPIHDWFDESKKMMPDYRHRALRHHAEGIFMCEQIFGTTITNSNGRTVPVRFIGEQHVREDCGFIPTMQDWFKHIRPAPWMRRVGRLDEIPDGVDAKGRIIGVGDGKEGTPEIQTAVSGDLRPDFQSGGDLAQSDHGGRDELGGRESDAVSHHDRTDADHHY